MSGKSTELVGELDDERKNIEDWIDDWIDEEDDIYHMYLQYHNLIREKEHPKALLEEKDIDHLASQLTIAEVLRFGLSRIANQFP